ncbi:MAG: hypothetical protein HY782_03540 [Chloroflexi bacterium]|nr:hypothetical protein [Chloroflexota bacterium]
MRELTETEKQQLWEEVRAEFPGDQMMQEIHYIRLLHHHQLEFASFEDRVGFFASVQQKEPARLTE